MSHARKNDALSREECRALDRAASERYGMPPILLMEHASIGAALIAARVLGGSARAARVWIVCGPGNNGGDGYAVARHLDAAGAEVSIWSLGKPEGDARVNYEMVERRGLRHEFVTAEPVPDAPRGIALTVDALFGTGLTRAPEGRFASAIERMNGAGAPVLALDLPSGLDCDRGIPFGACVRASWTATFAALKRGFLAPESRRHTGEVFVVPIGLPPVLVPKGMPVATCAVAAIGEDFEPRVEGSPA